MPLRHPKQPCMTEILPTYLMRAYLMRRMNTHPLVWLASIVPPCRLPHHSGCRGMSLAAPPVTTVAEHWARIVRQWYKDSGRGATFGL